MAIESLVGQRISHYYITGELGRNAWGVVYRGEDTRTGRLVVLKFLPEGSDRHQEAFDRFRQEARGASALNHPHICTIYDIDDWEGQLFLVMELLEGESLEHRLMARSPGFLEYVDIGAQVADALSAAHAAGIVHRDIRPANILITRRGQVKLLGFGLKWLVDSRPSSGPHQPLRAESSADRPKPGAGEQAKLVAYLSPEQARGEEVDSRSDLFSLGVVLYEMAAGKPPFTCDTAEETTEAILNCEPHPPSQANSQIPEQLDAMLAKALEKQRELRYQAAAEMRTDLWRLRRDWESDRMAAARLALTDSMAPPPATGLESKSAQASPASRRFIGPARPSASARNWGLILAVASGLAAGAVAMRLLWRPAPALYPIFHRLTYRGAVFSARFTPGGKTVVYTAAWGGSPPQVYSVEQGVADSRSLGLDDARILSVSSAGELALLANARGTGPLQMSGTLARVPPGGGAPQPVAQNIEWADWSPDGSGLAIVRRVQGFDRLEYPLGTTLYQTSGWIDWVRFSPKGDGIAFLHHPRFSSEGGSVDWVDLAGHEKNLSADWFSLRGLAWSPAGDQIWFTGSRRTERQLFAVDLSGNARPVAATAGSLTLTDISGSGQALLIQSEDRAAMFAVTRGESVQRDLSWLDWSQAADVSPDDKTVLINEAGDAGGANSAIYLRDVDGSPAVRVGEGFGLALSPDGQWVLAETSRSTHQLALLSTQGAVAVSLPKTDVNHVWAGWLPDGKRFVFVGNQPGHRPALFVEDTTNGPARAISPEGVSSTAAISPDGRYVAAVGPDGKGHEYPVDGGPVSSIRGLTAGDRPVGWSQGGGALFVAQGGPPAKVYRLELANGARTLLWQLPTPSGPGVSRIGPIRVSGDGRLCVYSSISSLSSLFLAEGLH
ncbi:MAG TPA: protein kinase [Candidatus Acidoferrales bacterium]|nr:protein kinase [Candidatus Acidoferrales bacterium]